MFLLLFQKLNQSSKDCQPISIINFSNFSRGKLISKSFIFLTKFSLIYEFINFIFPTISIWFRSQSKFQNNFSDKKIIGISALPGTGKTTLGKWLEAISLKLNFKIAVISIDDFYLPSNEMKLAIQNNPWNVSRGFPGSHSVKLMHEKLLNWKINGELNVPVFDKSLRNGLGDRSHWRLDNPDLLILEGWFLGIEPYSIDLNDRPIDTKNLTVDESSYVLKIQNNLNEYLDIWTLIDNIWHLKPLKIEYMNIWKTNQEKEMFLQKGNALQDEKLSNFLRMLNVSIPHKSFNFINSYALLLIDQKRNLVEAGLNF